MSKKSAKIDELIEALCDERVINTLINKLQEKIISDINDKMESKFKEFLSQLNVNLKTSITQVAADIIKDSISPCKNDILKLDERLNAIEARSVQNDIVISGLKDSEVENTDKSSAYQAKSTSNVKTLDLVIEHLRKDLDIQVEKQHINFAFRTRKANEKNPSNSSPIIVSFSSLAKKNEVLIKAKTRRNQSNADTYPLIFYNDRLTKLNSQLAFMARTLQKNKSIASTWTFRGEIYIRKDQLSKPIKISNTTDLNKYG